MTELYMLQDLLRTLAAVFLFPLFLILPGYVIGWFGDVLDFRKRLLLSRLVISCLLSIAITPIIAFLIARLTSFNWLWVFYGATWLLFIGIIIYDQRDLKRLVQGQKRMWQAASITSVLMALIVVIGVIDIQVGNRVYFSVISRDYGGRASITAAIVRTGVPPNNPAFFPGYAVPLKMYYYFWLMLCALVDQMGGSLIEGKDAVAGSAFWIGLALLASLALYLRTTRPGKFLFKRTLIAFGLLAITGLDVIPVMIRNLQVLNYGGLLIADGERWNTQVTSWSGTILWVPHHLAALVACITALMVFRWGVQTGHRSHTTLITGLALASSAGLSTWVTLVFAVFWIVWFLMSWSQMRQQAVLMILVGVVALVFALPYLVDIVSKAGGNFPVVPTIRAFGPAQDVLGPSIREHTSPLVTTIVLSLINLLCLPLSYLLEFGFFGIGGLIYYDNRLKQIQQPHEKIELILLLTSLGVCTFFKSDVLANDLGWRGMLFAQFILLIWGVDIVVILFEKRSEWLFFLPPRLRLELGILLVIGLITSVHNLVLVRVYPVLGDMDIIPLPSDLSPDRHLGERTAALRAAYDYVQAKLPIDVVLQQNPNFHIDRYSGLYSDRQVTVSDQLPFGLEMDFYNEVYEQVLPIFEKNPPPDIINAICRKFAIDVLVIKDTDPVWQDQTSWVWQREPVYANKFARLFTCG